MRQARTPRTRLGQRLALATLAVLALAACSSSKPVRKAEELRTTDFRLLELNRTTEELRRDVLALRNQVEAVRTEAEGAVQGEDGRRRDAVEVLDTRLAALEKRLDGIAGTVRGIEMTLGGLADQVARLEAVPTNATASRRDSRPTKAPARAAPAALPPEEIFGRAMESFKGGELGQAVLDFEELVARHPTHALAGTAQFWIGEAYYNAREYQHAAVEYKKAVDIAPKGEKTPDALFKLGLANRALKRQDRARDAWTQLVRDFPQSEAAQRARTAMREVVSQPPRPGSSPER